MSGISTDAAWVIMNAKPAYGKPHVDAEFYRSKEDLIIGSLGLLSESYDAQKEIEALTRVQKELARRKRNLKRELKADK